MDPCIHPELTQITGFLAGYGKGPVPQKELYPILAMCSTPLHSDVLTVCVTYSVETAAHIWLGVGRHGSVYRGCWQ